MTRGMNVAWSLAGELRQVGRWLEGISESAAASPGEALEETLTVHCLGGTGALCKTLLTANPVESASESSSITRAASSAETAPRWPALDLLRPGSS